MSKGHQPYTIHHSNNHTAPFISGDGRQVELVTYLSGNSDESAKSTEAWLKYSIQRQSSQLLPLLCTHSLVENPKQHFF